MKAIIFGSNGTLERRVPARNAVKYACEMNRLNNTLTDLGACVIHLYTDAGKLVDIAVFDEGDAFTMGKWVHAKIPS